MKRENVDVVVIPEWAKDKKRGVVEREVGEVIEKARKRGIKVVD